MKKKLLFIITICLFQHSYSNKFDDWNNYLASILILASGNKIDVYDSTLKIMKIDDYRKLGTSQDTFVNDNFETVHNPKFVNNIYHDSFTGTIVYQELNWANYDTISSSIDPTYIVFFARRYDPKTGDDWGRIVLFAVEREFKLKDNDLKQDKLSDIQKSKNDYDNYKLLVTKKNERWKIQSISINNTKYETDSCQSKYNLNLNANLSFEHSYDGNMICITDRIRYSVDIVAGYNSDITEYSKEGDIIKSDKLGIWTVIDKNLILMEDNGIEICRYKIKEVTNNVLIIENGKTKIALKKVANY
jgi:hypothetical protein